jgi:hypothetical protein
LTLKSFKISKAVNIAFEFGIICGHLPCCAITNTPSFARHVYDCMNLNTKREAVNTNNLLRKDYLFSYNLSDLLPKF